MTNITRTIAPRTVGGVVSEAEARLDRVRRGLPVFSDSLSLSGGTSFVAKRNGVCQVCSGATLKGEVLRAVGGRRYAHWQCVEKAAAEAKGPSGVVGAAQRFSHRTELRRRVFWAVPCDDCGAGVGEGCRKPNGLRRTRNHVVRMVDYSKAKRAREVTADAEVLAELRQVTERFRDFLTPVVVDEDDVDVRWDAEIEWASLRL